MLLSIMGISGSHIETGERKRAIHQSSEESPCARYYRASRREVAQFSKATVFRIARYHMVEHLDFEKLTGPDEVAGHFDVRFRWLRFTARVIVHEHDGGGCRDHGATEHLSWVYQDCIQRANCEQLMAFDPTAGV